MQQKKKKTFELPPACLQGLVVYIVLLPRVADMMYCVENEAAGTLC